MFKPVIKNLWATILKVLENKGFKITKSLSKGILEIVDDRIVNIYLDQKNISLIKSSEQFNIIKTLIYEILDLEYEIEFKPQENEYEFLKKQNLFLERINKLDYCYCNQNTPIFKQIEKFLSSQKINFCCLEGNKGIGKTHLIGVFLNTDFKGNFIYIDSFELINKFYENKRLGKSFKWFDQWISKYPFVILDSFQLINDELRDKQSTIKNLFKENEKTQKILVITNEQKDIEGKIFPIKMNEPELEDVRLMIDGFLKKQNKNIKFSQDSIDYLSRHLGTNFQNIINKLLNILLIIGNSDSFTIVDLNYLKAIINNTFFFDKKAKSINFSNNQQVKAICEKLNFDIHEIFMNTRKKDIVFKRNLVIYVLKRKFNLTHEEIGKIFSKNHSTISHSIRLVEEKLKDKHFKKYLDTFFSNY